MPAYAKMTRIERDALGTLEVPFDALYGIQTLRACRNFPISGLPISRHPELLRALALVKKAVASANHQLGALSETKASIIARVCDEIIAGQHANHFPVDVFQGGAGTSTNMNMNEVIANRGLELMGQSCGTYAMLHPNDDVNRSQSTNDVYPTAVRLALLLATPTLVGALADLADAFDENGRRFSHVLKLGRTQLQDAVPMTLGQEMHAYAVTLREDLQRLNAAQGLLSEVNLGGTAIGTGITANAAYRELAIAELARLSGVAVVPTQNLIEASWDVGAFVHFSGLLKRIATKLSKISSDLRLLASGPRGGLGEIRLPAMQPGSSIMPGKVNPVIPEVVNQVAYYVIGVDVSVTFASEAGQLQLNAFEPLIAHSLLQSVHLLRNAAITLNENCVVGILADEDACRGHLEASTAYLTALIPVLGYERVVDLAQSLLSSKMSLRELLSRMTDVSLEELDWALNLKPVVRSAT